MTGAGEWGALRTLRHTPGSAPGSSTEFNSLLAASQSAQLTCMGLHVLQEIVIKLELDSTSSTGVRLCLGEISSEELHRVCRKQHRCIPQCVQLWGRAWHSSAPAWAGLGWPWHLLLLHFTARAGKALQGSSCCCVWAPQGSAQGFLQEAAHSCSLP